MPLDTRTVAQAIARATGLPFEPRERRRLSGGDIKKAMLLGDGQRRYFVKFNRADLAPMLAAEVDALQELAHCPALHIPAPICRERRLAPSYAWPPSAAVAAI